MNHGASWPPQDGVQYCVERKVYPKSEKHKMARQIVYTEKFIRMALVSVFLIPKKDLILLKIIR